MNRFLFKCLLFFVIAAGLNLGYVIFLKAMSPTYQKVDDARDLKDKNVDLLIFGNSMALDGFDAQWLTKQGIPSYNMAVGGCHISSSTMQMEHYLQHNKAPKYAVLALSGAIGNSYLNKIPYPNPEMEFVYHDGPKEWVSNPPLLNLQWLFIDALKIVISKEHREATIELGQWRTQKCIPDQGIAGSHVVLPRYYVQQLLPFLASCKTHHIEPILVEMPAGVSKRNHLPAQYNISLAGTNYTVFNANASTESATFIDDQTDWLSENHLNVHGGEKFTKYFFDHILKQ
ncbi:MAG: hypothetical protein CFE24_03670 [Flavobacterium sp. BFFFF2]|nr:MAG: hypothetical protein CFE24_03670 [Flavobacterium sp. BFFFF2]